MKEHDKYETPKSSSLMRFLWKCAGGDRYFLERATYSDQVKYACLGGIIVATGGMAMLSGGYAFYTIFSPKSSVGELLDSPPHYLMAILFGIIWGLIIFNIDRFIVTSTGKGDGTEKITWDEFKGAIPRIIMGIIIAITISKPIEIRMFQNEIQAELIKKKADQENIYKIGVENRHKEKLNQIDKDITELKIEKEKAEGSYNEALNIAIEKCGSNKPGCPNHIGIWNNVIDKKDKRDNLTFNNDSIIKKYNTERNGVLTTKGTELENAKKDGEKLDGLLERLSILHEITSKKVSAQGKITYSFPWIIFFVTMLFITIELTPIFFKLMLTKTPYDYLTENRDDIIKAEYGIEVRYDYYKDKKGQERHLVINHEAERVIYEKIKITEIQKELTDYAIKKYKAQEKEKIDANLEDYIKKIETNNINDEETKG